MSRPNPLIAQRQDSTEWYTGISIAESAADIWKGIESGSWSEIALGGLGVVGELDALSIDPVATVASWGLAWLVEHVKPLSDALDWLAGDPDQIAAYAQTWKNVSASVGEVADQFTNEANALTTHWRGEAADAYKGAAGRHADAIKAASAAAASIASTVEMVGILVGVIRQLVRDLVIECLITLTERLAKWALEEGLSAGLATPAVVGEAASIVGKWVAKIQRVLLELTGSLEKLRPLLKKLDEVWERIKKAVTGKGGPEGTNPAGTKPHEQPPKQHTPEQQKPEPHTSEPEGTTPSSNTPPATHPQGKGEKKIGDPHEQPPGGNTPAREKNCEGDPIDVATGDMVLTQTDVELPGALPLVIKRVHLSSYRVGRFFGETWGSTLDQRLEVDDKYVRFASDDGTRVFYPHPAPGESVLPDKGPRLPLQRTEDGGYVITDPEQGRTLHFPSVGAELALAAITDRNGNRIDFDRDVFGVPTEIRHSGGYRIRAESSEGLITGLFLCEADGSGGDVELIRYGYGKSRLTEIVNASGQPLKFTYDDVGRITSWVDRNGAWYRYTYDGNRVVEAEGSGGFLSGSMEYDLENRVTTWTNSLGHKTVYHINEAGQTIREVDALGSEALSEWDEHDRLLSRTDPLGRTSRYEYDEAGNMIAASRPDGSQTRFEYNEMRLPTTIIAPDGTVSRREYDHRGNLTRVVDPAGAVTTYTYDERGCLSAVTDALGNVRRVETNAAGLPVAVTDPLGHTTRYERDGFGRVTSITDPVGGVMQLGWTVDGKPAWRILPDGATERWMYDGEGNLRTHIDPLGQTTLTEVTHFDLPSAEIRPDGTRLEFAYDTELRLVQVTNEQGLTWCYDYDPAGNLVRETDFNNRAVSYQHDAAGQLISRTNGAGEITQYVHDVLGNVIERRTGSTTTTFSYDAMDRLTEALDSDTQITFQRDPRGDVVAESINGRAVTSAYDALGRRVRRRTPSGAESVWEYDANDQPVALHSAGRTLRFGYDPAGREIQRALGGGTVLQQSWDANHQLRSQTLTGKSGQLQQRSYSYRADGYLTGIDDQRTGQRDFTLDLAGRVTSVQGSGWSERYAYDAAGNVATAAWPAPARHPDAEALGDREYHGTLVRRAGNVRYEHDTQGRVVLRQRKRLSQKPETWRYFWDADDRLTEVLTPDGTRWRYRYDALGRRTAKQRLAHDGSVAEQIEFVWDGVVIAEQAHSNGVPNGPNLGDTRVTVWDYEPGTFRPITQNERSPLRHAPQQWVDENFFSIVTDLVGTPTEMLGDQGEIAWFHRTTLWGTTTHHSRTGAYTALRFPGQYHDPETGFNYNFQRHYDPTTGRYASADPLGLLGGTEPHGYVHNPHTWIDPLGLKSSSCGKMQREVERGLAPSTVHRIDPPRIPHEKPHVHLKDNPKSKQAPHALNNDGTWKHGGRKLSNEEKKWLKKHGWTLPE